jgi:hypothetical protein
MQRIPFRLRVFLTAGHSLVNENLDLNAVNGVRFLFLGVLGVLSFLRIRVRHEIQHLGVTALDDQYTVVNVLVNILLSKTSTLKLLYAHMLLAKIVLPCNLFELAGKRRLHWRFTPLSLQTAARVN